MDAAIRLCVPLCQNLAPTLPTMQLQPPISQSDTISTANYPDKVLIMLS